MTSSALALQEAIFARLSSSPGLLAALGGARIYDDAPQPVNFPYITLGQSSIRDGTTSTEPGDEHLITLHVWSRSAGKRETLAIATIIRDTLHDAALTLTGHHLVNLRQEFFEARRDSDGETIHGLVRFRAVTEPL